MGLNSKDIILMMKRYQAGESINNLAQEYGIHPNSVHNIRRRLGIEPRRSRGHTRVMTPEVEQEARAALGL